MTSRCRGALSIVLFLSAIVPLASIAQDGTRIPAPPVIRHKQDNSADTDFQSPMKQLGNPGNPNANGGDNDVRARRAEWRRRRAEMMENGNAGNGGVGASVVPNGENGAAAFAGRGRRGGGGAPGFAGSFVGAGHKQLDLTPLNLTEEQKQQIRSIRKNTREQARDVRRALIEKQMALRSLVFSPDATDEQIRRARRELRQLQDKMEDLNLNDLLQIRGTLTAEQRAKLPGIAPPVPDSSFGPRGGAAISERRNP